MNRNDTRALTPRPAVRTQLHEPNYYAKIDTVLDVHRREAGLLPVPWTAKAALAVACVLGTTLVVFLAKLTGMV